MPPGSRWAEASRAEAEPRETAVTNVVSAFLDGGSPEPEVRITLDDSEFDVGLTFVQIDRIDSDGDVWGTLAGLLLDEFQVGELIVALQKRRHIIS
jgi:hypothetical protein